MGQYDVAQICENGHVTNARANRYPTHSVKFCSKCGSATITSCPNCSHPIRGAYYSESVIGPTHYDAPSFCGECGNAFPWTSAKLMAAGELAESFENLTEQEIEELKGSLPDLVRDTARTPLAESKFKRLLLKVGKEGADAMRTILTDVVSETVRKTFLGP